MRLLVDHAQSRAQTPAISAFMEERRGASPSTLLSAPGDGVDAKFGVPKPKSSSSFRGIPPGGVWPRNSSPTRYSQVLQLARAPSVGDAPPRQPSIQGAHHEPMVAEPGGDNGVGDDAGRSFGGDAGDELESPDDQREPERQLTELAGQPVR